PLSVGWPKWMCAAKAWDDKLRYVSSYSMASSDRRATNRPVAGLRTGGTWENPRSFARRRVPRRPARAAGTALRRPSRRPPVRPPAGRPWSASTCRARVGMKPPRALDLVLQGYAPAVRSVTRLVTQPGVSGVGRSSGVVMRRRGRDEGAVAVGWQVRGGAVGGRWVGAGAVRWWDGGAAVKRRGGGGEAAGWRWCGGEAAAGPRTMEW